MSQPRVVREVVLLGSTGSIGTQAIDVVQRNPDKFRVVGLLGGGGRVDLLAQQALDLGVEVVGVAAASAAQDLQLAFYAEAAKRGYRRGGFAVPKILAGPEAAIEIAAWQSDIVLNGITGSVGLAPTLSALAAGRTVALANKESLVAGGPLVLDALGGNPDRLIPVDSEHSALAQCLRGGRRDEVRRLVLTASGGPFRGKRREELAAVTREQALAHPTWDMGPFVTINSATLMNKGLELIEAHLFFGVPYDDIAVVVHPQSLVHSMVEFYDGSTIAQVSPPDMRLPIALALGWPDRVPEAQRPMDWTTAQNLTFFPLDDEAFPAVGLARESGKRGGTAPAVFNAANEEAVGAFLAGKLPFVRIVDIVAEVLSAHEVIEKPSLDEVFATEREARAAAGRLIERAVADEGSVVSR
ncbi:MULTISPECIES: 1-deoxy-D-xylulose-5-phosphate reductoisomerase [unclassified Pseudofrankia]|uniref:1-deoxy-D-xylulose-5-phosphate reductoisomerase n=1 Tax=unclassified Pseudofrankia TaxID=2994372 RepID=UPI0008DA7947|nr:MULTISPECIES: 1-deoxy-D-xylulose-5-phosphate reductoisomerase [unclassified Pseudofrankia]MDT3443806.1 1-deoxy-D-xylulose-5-phosphate reductoisomerase [Pseudofrankia sp. BMG5.37]OHV50074.1 1-deoxy-D-xylulose-5-phosphate reductoisomerase [Pseudofrankia sp. BMG5.36]